MAAGKKYNETMGLEDWAGLFGLPPLMDLLKDGEEAEPEVYRAVLARLLNHYLRQMVLHLVPEEGGKVRLEPFPGYLWRDAAYLVGHLKNLAADREVVSRPEDLIEGLGGAEAGEEDFKRGVLANLSTVAGWPGVTGAGKPVEALKRALEHARLVKKVREKVRQNG